MQAIIQQQLDRIETQHNVRILLAIESGSRAWGFASPDSDYDVRFIYYHPQSWYLSVFEQRDVIELPVDDVLDINGWDVRKALRLLWKSNAALLEWLHSPIVYRAQDAQRQHLDALICHAFLPRASTHHYLAMAQQAQRAIAASPQASLKKYFYALRACLCSLWIVRFNSVPPVRFQELLTTLLEPNNDVAKRIQQYLTVKTEQQEQATIAHDPLLDTYLNRTLQHCADNVPADKPQRDIHPFDEALRLIIRSASA